MADTKDTNDFVSATPEEITPAAQIPSWDQPGQPGFLNGKPDWITSDELLRREQAKFDKGKQQ